MAFLVPEEPPLQRRRRWTCPNCGLVNRAFRQECFGENCNATVPTMSHEPPQDDTTETTTTTFKDENSNIICTLPTNLAKCMQADLRMVVQGLVEKSNNKFAKQRQVEETTALQTKMRKGTQVQQDFENKEGALWGYTRRKFSIRAMIAFDLWKCAQEQVFTRLEPQLDFSSSTIISVGGGPGNDMFGCLLFEKYSVPERHTSRRIVVDYAKGWEPIVSHVGELSGYDIEFQTGDLSLPLQHETNKSLRQLVIETSHTVLVFQVVYVLSEVMGPHGEPPVLLRDLLEQRLSHDFAFLFREPHSQALRNLLAWYPNWRQGTEFWHLSTGGLVVMPSKNTYGTK